MKSSKSKNEPKREPVIVRLTCIRPEERELLDKLCDSYDKFMGEEGAIHTVTSPYSVLYWACRYSGLIEEKKLVEENEINIR